MTVVGQGEERGVSSKMDKWWGQNEYTLAYIWPKKILLKNIIVNRPSGAGAVLQSSPLLTDLFIHSFIDWSFSSESSRHCLSQTWRAGELKFWEIIHPPACDTCHVSHVTCHMSCVTSHISHDGAM